MKTLVRWALLNSIGLAAILNPQGFAAQAPLTVTIRAEEPTVKPGHDVLVDVTVTNISKHSVEYAVSYNNMLAMDVLDKYDIQDGTGSPTGKNTIKHLELAGGGLRPPIIIKPGESKVVGTDVISVLHNLSRPGQYTIQMSRAVSNNAKDGIVKSNKITVTVIE